MESHEKGTDLLKRMHLLQAIVFLISSQHIVLFHIQFIVDFFESPDILSLWLGVGP